jgi:glycosyltransferase involved in cell wall biosynthesis
MKILFVHNRYRFEGGEERQMEQQVHLLQAKGHTVDVYTEDSANFVQSGPWPRILAMLQVPFSLSHYWRLRKTLRSRRPAIAHIHNVFPLLTPSIYYACKAEGVRVVQSVHNYRFMCANGLFLLPDGTVCERCKLGSHWNAARYNCYGGKRDRSAMMALTLSLHRHLGTFRKQIDAYVMTSHFLKGKLTDGGFPAQKMHLLPPLFRATATRTHEQEPRTLLFVGRLSREKGLKTLFQAAMQLTDWTFQVVGTGPLETELRQNVSALSLKNVHLLGTVDHDELQVMLQKATFLIVPSECYENLPTVFLEAWAYALPVIASRLGGMAEAVLENVNGFLFTPGDVTSLVRLVSSLTLENCRSMQKVIGEYFQRTYNPEIHYEKLMNVYQNVLS